MPARDLPARPHLDHLRHEAKALHRAVGEGDPDSLKRVTGALGVKRTFKLTDAQRVIAREYGFPTWARLSAQVRASRGFDEAVDAFLAAVQAQDAARARSVLHARPGIATGSLHVAAVLGLASEAERLIAEHPSHVTARVGDPAADPLLFLCFSPFHGESSDRDAGLLATARLLLDSGADPNTRDGRYNVPALYAVTGERSVLPIARLLLDAGANPTDGESVFHAAEHFHEDALELLLAAGADLNHVGDWGNTALYFLLRWWNVEREARVRLGLRWLLEHGADPNVPCGREQENSLHVAARRGQDPAIIRLLLDHGAQVNARRGDGISAWLLAQRGGFEEVAAVLERAGAETQALSALDLLLAACARGDVKAARALSSPQTVSQIAPLDRLLLTDAASTGRWATVNACLAAGFPAGTVDARGATALHHAALNGRITETRALLDAGADISVLDRDHASTPLGWAAFGVDHVADAEGDYEGCVQMLLDAGARLPPVEQLPRNPGVRSLLLRANKA